MRELRTLRGPRLLVPVGAGLLALLTACGGGTGVGVGSASPAPTGRTATSTPSPAAAALPDGSAIPTPGAAATPASAEHLLARLDVRGRAPRTGYDRAVFGQAWADTDRNGCDTRNDVLRRDLVDVVLEPGTADCVVRSGTLQDPFSGSTIRFVRGPGTSPHVQIDHVVALSDAWQKGAQQWTPQRRVAFANDPVNLLAVDGVLNAQKGDGDAATWLPPQRSSRCGYVARQVAVKARFGLWVTVAERDAMERVLAGCPGEPAPTGTLPTESEVGAATPPPTGSAPAAPAAPPDTDCEPAYPGLCLPRPEDGGDLDCGSLPDRRFTVLAPDPHHLDGDGNGIGCESD